MLHNTGVRWKKEDDGAVRQGNGVSVRRRRKKLVSSVGPLGDSVVRPVGEQGLGTVGNGDRGGVGYKGSAGQLRSWWVCPVG